MIHLLTSRIPSTDSRAVTHTANTRQRTMELSYGTQHVALTANRTSPGHVIQVTDSKGITRLSITMVTDHVTFHLSS